MKTKAKYASLVLGVLATVVFGAIAKAQSSDALLDKLVEKGILTVKEANDLREETEKDFTRAYSGKSGMPEWVTALKFAGDFRARYEGFYSDNPDFVDRNRFRYRMRFGAVATLLDNLEVGLRLTSSERVDNFGGDPISGNTTFTDNGSKKFVFIDLAYGKWMPVNNAKWLGIFTVGKMENPFVFPSTLMFDRDYTPEGFAQELTYRFTDTHTLKATLGQFALEEVSNNSNDGYLLGAQLRYDAVWNTKISTTLGGAAFAISGKQALTTANVPNINRGNTRNASGGLVANFNPLYVDGGFTYLLDSVPLFAGAFPIIVAADYLNNPGAHGQNEGYSAGIVFGKAGKHGTWEVAYRWVYLQSNAWYEEFTESDFGAFYQTAQPNSGFGPGYGAGTNVRGHVGRVSYSPYDSLTLSVTGFFTQLIDAPQPNSNSDMTRVQFDAQLRF